MSKKYAIGTSLSSSETLSGIIYLAAQLFVLPTVLYWINAQAGNVLNEAEINFMFYLINFISMLVIFRNFLSNSLQQLTRHPIVVLESVILGLVAYYACTFCTTQIIALLSPGYANYNDEAIFAMSQGNTFLLTVCTVVLVPPFEECMYRGLIFRNLYSKNKYLAYVVSIVLFAAVHILGYFGMYSPLELALAVLQYLPAGLCLAWCYARAETIFAPILMHAAINYLTIHALR